MVGEGERQANQSEQCAEVHATAELIARIASHLFAERGFDGTPVRAIAEAAGVTCPTLYYHFKSKEGLAHDLLTRPSAERAARLRHLLDHAGARPGRPADPDGRRAARLQPGGPGAGPIPLRRDVRPGRPRR